MSSYYLCETCASNLGYPDRARVCWYKYCDCRVHGDMRMLVMSDAFERPTDLCGDYERADSVEQVALNMLDALLSLGDTTAHRVYSDRLRALGVEA